MTGSKYGGGVFSNFKCWAKTSPGKLKINLNEQCANWL